MPLYAEWIFRVPKENLVCAEVILAVPENTTGRLINADTVLNRDWHSWNNAGKQTQ